MFSAVLTAVERLPPSLKFTALFFAHFRLLAPCVPTVNVRCTGDRMSCAVHCIAHRLFTDAICELCHLVHSTFFNGWNPMGFAAQHIFENESL